MSFRLFDDRIAVIPDEESDTLESGLVVLTDNAKEGVRYGTVHTVGAGKVSEALNTSLIIDLEPGNRVFFNRYSGSEVEIEDAKYLFLNVHEIWGVLEDEDEQV